MNKVIYSSVSVWGYFTFFIWAFGATSMDWLIGTWLILAATICRGFWVWMNGQ